MRPGIKDRLASGDVVVGTMVFEFSTSGIGRLIAQAGAEFVIYDMEHTGWTGETTRGLLASTPAELVPIVRVPANRYSWVAPQLDLGAAGIMVPMVGSAEAARDLASFTRYPPEGRRGAAFGIAHDGYSGGDPAEKVRAANRDVLTIAQVETLEGVAAVEEIAGVEGIDVVFLGQFDLSASLGAAGRFTDPAFTTAVERVVAATKKAGKALGVLALSPEEARGWIDAGATMIAFGGDLWLYQTALRNGLEAIRGSL
jgi:2-dehydro-3-deoxyglucarate aldolase/4-hydroxy-2-oxoheptanedioate aldolase